MDDTCKQCGKCCTAILPISDVEISAIKKYIKNKKIKPQIVSATRTFVNRCPFLTDENKCVIYNTRFDICKYYLCYAKEIKIFDHKNKSIKNLWEIFYPSIKFTEVPDIEAMDSLYQSKKKKAGF